MFNVAVIKLKDLAKYLLTLVIIILVIYGVNRYFFYNKKNQLEDIDILGKITNSISKYVLYPINVEIPAISEINQNDNNTNSVNNANDTNLVNSENIVNVATSSEASNSVTSSSTTSTSEYFKELKLDRDNMYSEKLEAYQKIVDSTSISSEQKAIAIQEIEKITEVQNLIEISEELIKLKGFEDVVIYVNENAVTVIVRSADLTSSQVAQIQSIVTRQLNVEATNISISNK